MKKGMSIIYPLILCLALALPAFAAGIPTTLSYQGNLTDKAGNGITGSRTLVFSLYSVDTGGTAFWTEQQSLTITGGKFSAVLGATTPIGIASFGGDTWLGLAVLSEPEMTPRQKMTSVPYAFNGVPKGVITMWSGSIATIPAGWALCNGSNGTPNLQDRFIVGAGQTYAQGTSGGNTNLSTGLSGNHNHSGNSGSTALTIDQMPNHVHQFPGDDALGSWSTQVSSILLDYDQNNSYYGGIFNTSSTGGGAGHAHSISNSGDHNHSYLPPYYALVYIMKL
jgi:hypothetical protein